MKYILFIVIIFISTSTEAQIRQIGKNTFEYKERNYTAKGLGPILKTNRMASFSYREWQKSLKGPMWIIVGTGLAVWGQVTRPDPDEFILIGVISEVTSLMLIATGAVVGTIGIVKLTKGRNRGHLYNAIDVFNNNTASTYSSPPPKINIEFGYSGGNVGLFCTF